MSTPPLKHKNIPSPHEAKGTVYGRFIPREELAAFAAWTPGSVHDPRAPAAPAPAPEPAPPPPPAGPSEEEIANAVRQARQGGYQDGYRDGLAALEAFKQTCARQLSAQLGTLFSAHEAQLTALDDGMAAALTACATALARQVVRSELVQRPQQVAQVARQAVDALMLSARHITVHVHPEDLPLVAQGAAEALAARGARLVDDEQITRGGCRIESDIGGVDATIESRWKQSVAALGRADGWDDPASAPLPRQDDAR